MTEQKPISAKDFFEGEWYKDGLKQLCADGWPTFVVPVNIKIRELIEENAKLRAENERLKTEFVRCPCCNEEYSYDQALRGADEK